MDSAKALGLFRLELNRILQSAFDLYGLGIHIPEVATQLEKATLKLHERLNGDGDD